MENVTAVKNFVEYVAPGELGSLDELERGKGAIIRRGVEKLAAYRDDKGTLHLNSATCSHVGCHLHWNSFEPAGTARVMVRCLTWMGCRSTRPLWDD